MTIVPRITCANLRKSSASVTAIGFKGQRNNNRGGGRRPGFEASALYDDGCIIMRVRVD